MTTAATDLARALRKLAAGQQLKRGQAKQLAQALQFLAERLLALELGEKADLQLFQSPTLRTMSSLVGIAGRASFASRISPFARRVFLQGKAVAERAGGCRFAGCLATVLNAAQGAKALFVWDKVVYAPEDADPLESKHASLLGPVGAVLGDKDRTGLPTTWSLLNQTLPARGRSDTGWLAPSGRGFVVSTNRPTDRPALPVAEARSLTTFFYDEPMTQAYSRDVWLMVGPQRLFALIPGAGKTGSASTEWLHEKHEAGERALALETAAEVRQARRQKTLERSERRRRRKLGKKGPGPTRQRTKPARTKPVSMAALYDMLTALTQALPSASPTRST